MTPPAPAGRRPIRAVIFDMDGLLLDSESLYTKISNEVLAPYNKQLTWEIKSLIMGRPALESATILVECTGVPITPSGILAAMAARQTELFPTVKPMPGAIKLVEHLVKHNIPIAIATGSIRRNFELKSSNLPQLFSPFDGRVVCSDDLELKRGKPSPDPFLLAARRHLGLEILPDPNGYYDVKNTVGIGSEGSIQPDEILVFEDGLPGVSSAKAAGMQVVWVPEPELKKMTMVKHGGSDSSLAGQVLSSLEDWDGSAWGLPSFD